MTKNQFFSLLLSSFSKTVCFLHAETTLETTKDHLIHKVIQNQNFCVSAFNGDKIFIRPENIVSTTQGLFIKLNGDEYYPMPLLQFNRNGHFMQGSFTQGIELAAARKEETKGPCPECGINTNKYGICKNNLCFFMA